MENWINGYPEVDFIRFHEIWSDFMKFMEFHEILDILVIYVNIMCLFGWGFLIYGDLWWLWVYGVGG